MAANFFGARTIIVFSTLSEVNTMAVTLCVPHVFCVVVSLILLVCKTYSLADLVGYTEDRTVEGSSDISLGIPFYVRL